MIPPPDDLRTKLEAITKQLKDLQQEYGIRVEVNITHAPAHRPVKVELAIRLPKEKR